MEKESVLELVAIFQEIIEKQEDTIKRLREIVVRQATDIQFLQNNDFLDEKLEKDTEKLDEKIREYKNIKNRLEP